MFLQNQVEIITIDDDEPDSCFWATNDSAKIEQVIHQDLTDIDEGTWSIINAIQTNDKKVHAGQDEDTITLVTKLENESKVEQRNHEKEKHKKTPEKNG